MKIKKLKQLIAITIIATTVSMNIPININPTVAFASDITYTSSEATTAGFTYTLINDTEYEITGYKGTSTNVTIPSQIDGKNVTSIGANAFVMCYKLTSITIPNSVTSIGNGAFNSCAGLTSITIPSSVTSIGDEAFNKCSKLTSITIPNSVTSIGNGAFVSCDGLTSITIPSSVTSIGDNAFGNCVGLIYINIPSSVTSIGNGVFYNCTELTSITIPSSVTSIGISAFDNCTSLTSVTIPSNVESIGQGAFGDCTGLTSITIPSSVTSIDTMAFANCTGLTSITIPSSITSIGMQVFQNCTKLTSITIPSSVTSIGYTAFQNCTGLTSITIPSSVTSIGAGAFYQCSGLTSITIPSSVTSIDAGAFYQCSGLKSITIPISVTSIGSSAFDSIDNNAIFYVPNDAVKDLLKTSGYPASDTNQTVVIQNQTYTVTYDGNGSTGGSVPLDSGSYTSGLGATILSNTGNLVKTGYTFAGWNTAADGRGTDYAAGSSLSISGNVTLYAKWTQNPTYTVTYDGNGSTGGTTPSDSGSYTSGGTAIVLGNTGSLVKTGNTFVDWNTAADGTGTDYAAGSNVSISGNVRLYAKWTANPTYTVTYDGNGSTGGTTPSDSGSYTSGGTATVLGNTGSLVKTGNTFVGWNTAADGTGTDYAAGSDVSISGNVRLYAKWTANPTYTVTLSEIGTYTFVAQAAGYSSVTPYSVDVTNTGTGNIGNLAVTISGTNPSSFDLGILGTSLNIGNTTSFTINPKTGLSAGTYTAIVTVAGDNGVSESFNVSFKVHAQAPTEVILATDSLGTAGDSKVTGLTSGLKYKVGIGGTLKYVKGNGTLSDNESYVGDLTGTEIIGLTNGTIYNVQEYTTSAAVKVVLEGGSLGTAGDKRITGLTTGNKYKVIVNGVTEYVKADGTLSTLESEVGNLNGTEITGLTNGITYKVEKYTHAPITYTLTYTAGLNGTITGNLSQTVNSGGSGSTITAVPNSGYHFVSWSDGLTNASRTDSNVNANISVSARFAVNTSSSGNSSSSSSSSSSNSTSTQITVAVTDGSNDNSISQTVINRTTEADGTQKDEVKYTADKAEQTVDALKKEGKDVARIVVPDAKDEVSEAKVSIPTATIAVLSKSSINLEIETENAIISLPKESIQDLSQNGIGQTGDLYFNLVPIKDEIKQNEIQARANQEQVVKNVSGNSGVQVLGRPMTIETNMRQRAVNITLPLKGVTLPSNEAERQAFLNDLVIYIEHSDGTKELVKGEIVEYAKGVFGIKFGINKFSNFTIVKLNQQGNGIGTWQNSAQGWKYIKNGQPATGWNQISGYWYLMDSTGIMQTGWKQTNGIWYLLKNDGAMATGWAQSNGLWYFLKDSGAMSTGWIQSNGEWYYLYSDGAMASSTVIDGYPLDASGAWVK